MADEEKNQMVSIPKETLDRMLEFMQDTKSQIARLTASADVGRLAKYDIQNQKELVRTVKLTQIGGKIIVAWKMVTNDLSQDINGRWHEDQTIEIVTENNDKKIIKYKPDFIKAEKINAELRSLYTTPEGIDMARVAIPAVGETPEKVIDICQTFLN